MWITYLTPIGKSHSPIILKTNMPKNWKTYKLGELVTFQRGHDLTKSENIDGIYPIAGSNGIIGYHSSYTTKAPGITIGRSGNIGRPIYFEQNFWAHNTTLYIKEFINCEPKFIFYLLKTINFGSHNSGSAVPSLNRNYIHPIEVYVPESLKEQSRIASILSSLDDKIELNLQMNKTLEDMAQAIFKEWFVEFRVNGKKLKLNSKTGLPEGWKNYSVSDLVDSVSLTNKFPKGKAIFLNTSDIYEGQFLHNNYTDSAKLPGQAKKKIQRDDILLSEIRPANKRYAYVDFEADNYVVSTKLMVLRSKGIVSNLYIYYIIKSENVLNQLQVLAESRSGTFPQITFTELTKINIPVPDENTLGLYTNYLATTYKKIRENQLQNQTLTQLRDTLLPQLMSGKIEV